MAKLTGKIDEAARAVPPHAWFGVSAVFHYLGPSFAVLLFPAVGVLGVAWMRVASASGAGGGIEQLGAAMGIAFIFLMPIGFGQAIAALSSIELVVAGIGVGVCSSVIPYVCDQLSMSQLPRSSYALLLALLPATATVIGIVVLRQIPTVADVVGIALVMTGVAVHKPLP